MNSIDELIRDSAGVSDGDGTERVDIAKARQAFDSMLANGKQSARPPRLRRSQPTRVLRFAPAAVVCLITLVIGIGAVAFVHHRPTTEAMATGTSSTTPTTVVRKVGGDQKQKYRQLLRHAQTQHVSASPQILKGFAVFSIPSGTRLPGGLVVSHPALTEIPYAVLSLAETSSRLSARGPAAVDLRETREVRTASGQAMYVIPGPNALCVYQTTALLPGASGAGGGCDRPVRQALLQGGGGAERKFNGEQVNFGIVSKAHPTLTITISHGRRRTITPPDGIYYVTS